MIGALRPSHAAASVQPEPPVLACLCGTFSPSRRRLPSSSDRWRTDGSPFDPPMVHMPAAGVRHAGDHAATTAPELPRQLDDVLGPPLCVGQAAGQFAARVDRCWPKPCDRPGARKFAGPAAHGRCTGGGAKGSEVSRTRTCGSPDSFRQYHLVQGQTRNGRPEPLVAIVGQTVHRIVC